MGPLVSSKLATAPYYASVLITGGFCDSVRVTRATLASCFLEAFGGQGGNSRGS